MPAIYIYILFNEHVFIEINMTLESNTTIKNVNIYKSHFTKFNSVHTNKNNNKNNTNYESPYRIIISISTLKSFYYF